MKKLKGILVCDVCGTLFYENTTLGFIKFHTKKNSNIKFLYFLILTSNFSPIFWSFKLLEYFFSNKKHLFKKLIILFLKGESDKNINQSVKLYINFLFKKKKIQKVWNYLIKYRRKNFKIILASSSIEPVVKEISRKINAKYISSVLELKKNKYTGNVLSDPIDNKTRYLKLIGIDSKAINLFISDNFEDLDLIKNAKKGIAISHSSRNLAFWKKNKIKDLLCI